MNKAYFMLGIHNHQPVGNFPEVFEKAYQESYRPFIEIMARHQKFKWSLHASGILWDFLVDKHPEYIAIVKKMVDSGQVELLTGGYYEPISAVIPDRDKKGQITKLTKFLKKKFNYPAQGMWLAERIWEPHMAKPLSDAGVKFTVVDDAHFAASGMDVEKLRGYFITEEQGTPLAIFPISQRLRYYIPFKPVHDTINYMHSYLKDHHCPAFVMADDGEKFGHWPGTYKHVYEDGWLDNFLTEIEKHDWIETITFSEYYKKYTPQGRVYLPTASYFEMSEWSLPAESQEAFESVTKEFHHREDVKRFLRGGFWRNFLTKYSESNNMHKKMLYVSDKVNVFAAKKGHHEEIYKAFDALYASQCNCAYWHGVFGGLYLPHLRTAVYRELLKAESICQNSNNNNKLIWKQLDIDKDSREEIVCESKCQNIYFSPSKGGSIFEWDILPKLVNLSNVLTRRKEAYHKKLIEFISKPQHNSGEVQTIHDMVKVKEKDLDKYLNFDWYERLSLIDHFLHPETKHEDFRKCQYGEQGDFVFGNYDAEMSSSKIVLKREGLVWEGKRQAHIDIVKEVVPLNLGYKVHYKIKNREKDNVDLMFAPEFNFAFSEPMGSPENELSQVTQWSRCDNNFKFEISIKADREMDIWSFPLETVSLSEGGFERTYQGTVVLPKVKLLIEAGQSQEFELELCIKEFE